MSLWSNDGQVAEGALVGLSVALHRAGRNGGPETPFDPSPLEAALAEFVAGNADLRAWISEDGTYWYAELNWTGGISWDPVAVLRPDALARDIAAFAAWAEGITAWLRSRPVLDLPATTVAIKAEYGKSWPVPLAEDGVRPAEPGAAAKRHRD